MAHICRPVLNERVVYNHDTRVHGVELQIVVSQMGWSSNFKSNGKAEDMIVYYALWIRSIKPSQLSGWHGLIINLCFYKEAMLNQSVYICRPLSTKET